MNWNRIVGVDGGVRGATWGAYEFEIQFIVFHILFWSLHNQAIEWLLISGERHQSRAGFSANIFFCVFDDQKPSILLSIAMRNEDLRTGWFWWLATQEEVIAGDRDALGWRRGLWSAQSAHGLQSPLLEHFQIWFLMFKDAQGTA